jgi:hypothetical protein
MVTFLLSGLWHVWGALKVLGPEAYPPRAWLGFVTWGAMNGAAVVAGRWWSTAHAAAPLRAAIESRLTAAARLRASRALAFAFVALAWIPFFLPPWIDVSMCWAIFLRLLYLKMTVGERDLGRRDPLRGRIGRGSVCGAFASGSRVGRMAA